jgi:acyl carrier protein
MTPEQRAKQIIANMASGMAEIEPATKLDDLGLDSLDCIELSIRLANEFDFSPHWQDEDYTPSTNVRAVLADVARMLEARQ